MRLLVYGATGYTGKLLVAHAAARGLAPIAAGRSTERVKEVAAANGCEARVASLTDARALRAALEGVGVVLHAAGPFSATAEPMLEACLEARVHYLDVTGEVASVTPTLWAFSSPSVGLTALITDWERRIRSPGLISSGRMFSSEHWASNTEMPRWPSSCCNSFRISLESSNLCSAMILLPRKSTLSY